MRLSEAIISRLQLLQALPPCPCKGKQFGASDEVAMLPIVAGEKQGHAPFGIVSCTRCGYTRFHSLVLLGLVKAVPIKQPGTPEAPEAKPEEPKIVV